MTFEPRELEASFIIAQIGKVLKWRKKQLMRPYAPIIKHTHLKAEKR
jgi:hypothetical protein